MHKWEASKAAIEKAFGLPVEHMFESIDHSAIASGSIAQVLKPVAAATSKVPALKGLSLKESVSQFSSTMTAQADLRVECAHLRGFTTILHPCRRVLRRRTPSLGAQPLQHPDCVAGVDTYLKMLLADNFVHTDLHPGNIMTDKVSAEHKSLEEIRSQLQLVLLDFGLAEELTPRHQAGVPQPEAFADDMEALFNVEAQIDGPDGIDVDKVLKDVLKLARRHEVGIDSSYAALVLGVCVIVGFATSLDNRINIMDAATSCFLQHSLTGKATGRLY
ncbi:TPA: hypothetical protein ACH3X2_001174 [Trebouxia sp. C0005]